MSDNQVENKSTSAIKTPKWFKITSVIALIWNLMGVIAFVNHMMITPEMIAKLPEAEQALYQNTPLWATIAFAFAVIGGALGCLGLVLKKVWSVNVLIVSLVGVVVQMYHSFFVIDSVAVYGPGQAIMPIMVIVISIALVKLALNARANGWLQQ